MDTKSFQPSVHRVLGNENTNLGDFTLINGKTMGSCPVDEERTSGKTVPGRNAPVNHID